MCMFGDGFVVIEFTDSVGAEGFVNTNARNFQMSLSKRNMDTDVIEIKPDCSSNGVNDETENDAPGELTPCSICNRDIPSDTFETHSATHYGDRYQCPRCPKTFSQAGYTRIHMVTAHHEEKLAWQSSRCEDLLTYRITCGQKYTNQHIHGHGAYGTLYQLQAPARSLV